LRRIHEKPPRACPGSSQEASKRNPGGTQEAHSRPRKHPGSTQEAPRRHPKDTQEAPREAPRDPKSTRRLPGRPKLDLEGKCAKTIEFFCQKSHNRPFGAGETSPTLTKSGK